MASGLDMSLDDIIANNKKSGSGRRRKRPSKSGSGLGVARPPPNRRASRVAPYASVKAPETTWKHDMFSELDSDFPSQARRSSGIETGTKLLVSNLDYGVLNDDLKELFSAIGDLKRCSTHYDRSGRSKGTAEVVFSRTVDALTAIKRYNNVMLDGKPMKIEIVEKNTAAPNAKAANGVFRSSNGVQNSGGAFKRQRGGNRGGRNRGKGKDHVEKVSIEDLDADLENYHAEAMQTN